MFKYILLGSIWALCIMAMFSLIDIEKKIGKYHKQMIVGMSAVGSSIDEFNERR